MSQDNDNVILYEIKDKLYPQFDYDEWAKYLRDWQFRSDISHEYYKPCMDYWSLPISSSELIAFKRGFSCLLCSITKKIEQIFRHHPKGQFFFRMSTRSPKDVWITTDESLGISSNNSLITKKTKIERQLQLCRVSSVVEVKMLIKNSERIQSDMDLHIEEAELDHNMSLIFMKWQNIPVEKQIRVFVKSRAVIACCPYFGDLISDTQNTHIKSVIEKQVYGFIMSMSARLPVGYQDFVADLYESDDRLYFIELNPFDEITDPIDFSWQQLYNMSASAG